MEFDEALNQIGGFGRYQKWIFFLICWTSIPVAFHNMAYVFIAGIPEHRCASSMPENIQNDVANGHGDANHSHVTQNFNHLTEELQQCKVVYRPAINSSDNGNWTGNVHIQECTTWEYETNQFSETIVSKWDLVCNNQWMRATAQSVYMAGFLVGCVLFGDLSDRFGRRLTFLIATIIHVGFGLGVSFAPTYHIFTIMWFFVALGTAGAHNAAYILLVEVLGQDYRASAASGTDIFWAVGYIILGGITYLIRDWVTLQLVLNGALAIQILYYWLLPESPRWLLMKGRHKEAVSTMCRIAKINGRHLHEDITLTLMNDTNGKEEKRTYTVLDLVKTPRLRLRSLNLAFNWFVNCLVFYGLAWNIGQLAGDLYLNFAINGFIEIPAYIMIVVLLAKAGRRPLIFWNMMIGGVACLVLGFVPNEIAWLQTTLANIGKFGITASFTVVYVFTTELTPTVVRNVGLGVCSMSSRVAGMLAPYFGMLGEYNRSAPQLVFGVLSVLAAFLTLCMPETFKKPLPDTIEDGKNFGKDQNTFCFRKSERKNIVLTQNGDVENKSNGVNGNLLSKTAIDNTTI